MWRLLILLFIVTIHSEEYLVKSDWIDQKSRVFGKIRAFRTSRVGSDLAARVLNRSIEIGDRVKKDQILFELDSRELRISLKGYQANKDELIQQIEFHEKRLERRKKNPDAYTQEVIESENLQLERFKLQAVSFQSKIQNLNLKIEKSIIRAPFAGVITGLMSEIGEWVNPGQALLVLQDQSRLRLIVKVQPELLSEGDFSDLSLGTGEKVRFYKNHRIIDPSSGQIQLEFQFQTKSPELLPGRVLALEVPVRHKELKIPLSHVKYSLGRHQVKLFTKEGQKSLTVDGEVRNGFFYPYDHSLENKVLQAF